jgi:hypothetical protein
MKLGTAMKLKRPIRSYLFEIEGLLGNSHRGRCSRSYKCSHRVPGKLLR